MPPKPKEEGRYDEWMAFYRLWEQKYTPDYNDKEERDRMLLELGLTEQWISNSLATNPKLKKKLIHVGLRKVK